MMCYSLPVYLILLFTHDYFLFHGSNFCTWTRYLLSFRALFATKLQFYINLNRLCKNFLWFSQPDTLSLLLEYHRILFLALSPHLVVNSPNSHQMKLSGSLFVLALFLLIDSEIFVDQDQCIFFRIKIQFFVTRG